MFKSGRDYKLYLEDILRECRNIRTFVNGVTYETFTENIEKVYAVAKAFENIGEVVKNFPKELTKSYDDIPWSEIAKMGCIDTPLFRPGRQGPLGHDRE